MSKESAQYVKAFNSPVKPSWCPGCGDYGILASLKQALGDLQKAPHEVVIVSGIGCGSKLPDYIHSYGIMTLHGRPLPVATGVKLTNPELCVVVTDGDGDAFGIGGNHFLHTCRRNLDITHLVENNQIYALTKGQYSPTSVQGFQTTTSPEGAVETPMNPLAIALVAGASFIARGFSGEPKHLAGLIAKGITHKGYSLIEILQPCVTFNKLNTNEWYSERIYDVEQHGHDSTSFAAALQLLTQSDERLPIGVLFQAERPTYEEQVPGLVQGPLPKRELTPLAPDLFERLKGQYL